MIRISLILSVLLLAPLSGCLGTIETLEECVVSNGTDDNQLTILTYDSFAIPDEVLNEFTNQSGYEVDIMREGDAGSVLEKMLLTSDAPQADLAIGLDNTYLQTAQDNCLVAPHNATVPDLNPLTLVPYAEESAVPFDHGYICLNVDTEALDENNLSVPTTLEELTDEAWRGRTAFPSPTTSSPGRAFMTATIDYFEQEGTIDAMTWWEDMANNDAIFKPGWSETYEIHYSGGYGVWEEGHIGDAWLTVSYCHSPGVEAYYGGNSTISMALDIDHASFHQVEYATKINGGGDAPAVREFIEFLLSEDVNAEMPFYNFMYPVRDGLDLPETDGYRYHSPVPSNPAEVSNERIADEMEDWLAAWRDATGYL